MEQLILDALIGIGGLGLGALSLRAAKVLKKPKPNPTVDYSDIPHIEIDGEMVPHPTIVARREKRAAQLSEKT